MSHETMEFDIVIVGAGPAGLAAAIRLGQLNQQQGRNLSVCVLEKGAQAGAHILSGAVIDPKALNELIPDWPQKKAPLFTPAVQDQFLYLTQKKSFQLPTAPQMCNKGNYIISLDELCLFLLEQAESLGIQVFPGFPAAKILYDDHQQVCGVATVDLGLDKEGKPTDRYQPGIHLHAKQVLLAEGCRGSLTKIVIEQFDLYKNAQPQTYAIGIKELWEIPTAQHVSGRVIHTIGWPLNHHTYGGSFLYYLGNNQVAVGFVVGLDYQNPYLDPYEELQRFKTHPKIAPLFENGKRICYGARALNEGGLQCIPKLTFPGGMLIGDCAGFLNVPKIKGIHTAMKSGMIAAETIFNHPDELKDELIGYNTAIKNSWITQELYLARNIRPAMNWGLLPGLCYAAIDTYIFRGKAPWTLKYPQPDYMTLKKAQDCQKIIYPKHDGKLTFDKLDSVYLSNTHHRENQPCHLQLKDEQIAIDVNLKLYDSPETRYCPANVYEVIYKDNQPKLQINAANCVHCKTCDIKDPKQNINWTTPEGGDGPNYVNM